MVWTNIFYENIMIRSLNWTVFFSISCDLLLLAIRMSNGNGNVFIYCIFYIHIQMRFTLFQCKGEIGHQHTAVSTKVVQNKRKSVHDNAEWSSRKYSKYFK